MPPLFFDKSNIFARRVAIAGISLALGASLAGCPGSIKPGPPPSPAQITSVFTIGTTALEVGLAPTAVKNLTLAVHLAPEEPAVWANLGLYRLRNNELDAAAFDIERARSLMPATADAQSRAGIEALLALVADKKGDVAAAVEHYKQAVSLNPRDLLSRYSLAEELEKTGDAAGAFQTMQAIARDHPDNLEALLETARMAIKQNNASTLRQIVMQLDALSANWSPLPKQQLTDLKQVVQSGNMQKAFVNVQFVRNTLGRQPEYRRSFAALTPPIDSHSQPVVGVPLARFVKLPNAPDAPASPDMSVTFTVTPLHDSGKQTGSSAQGAGNGTTISSSSWAGPLWLSNLGETASLAAPFAMFADGRALHIDAAAYQGEPLAFPGGAQAAAPGPHGVLTLDYNYDLLADILLVGEGGLKLYAQGANGHYADVTAQLKLPPTVANGAQYGAWAFDYDADGDLDVLLAPRSGPPVALRNNGDGTFLPVSLFPGVPDLRDFAWADIDGDGAPDAALLDTQGALHIFMNQRGGKFKARPLPPDVGKIAAIAVADLDHDGKFDFILLRTDGTLLRLSDKLDGTQWETAVLTTWTNPPQDLAPGSARLFIADLDNNGALDIIASTPTIAQVWMNDGYKLMPLPSPIAAGITGVADINNDGRIDLLGIDAQGQPVLLTNKGTKNYFWQDLRPRAHPDEVTTHQNHQPAPASGIRVNSVGIGGEMEMRSGLLYQKQIITAPSVHFGLGEYPTLDVVRIVWPNGEARGFFEIKGDTVFDASHFLQVSCPFLFTWNGHEMEFVTDCIWRSPLGLKINAQDTAGIQMTEDWVKIRGDQLVAREGPKTEDGRRKTEVEAFSTQPEDLRDGRQVSPGRRKTEAEAVSTQIAAQGHDTASSVFRLPSSSVYDLRITAELWETHFFDHLSLMAVDHPVGTDIFCDERFAVPPPPLHVYATTPPCPVTRAWDDDGNEVTDLVRARDGRYLNNFGRGVYQGVTRDHWVELEFGDEVPRDTPLYLIAFGWIRPTNSNVNVALSQGDNPVPQGLSIEVLDAGGVWQTRKQDLGFPEGKVKTIVLRIDDVFLPDAPRRLRLRTNLEIYWGALQWATGLPETTLQTTRLAARTAELRYRGFSQIGAADASSPDLPGAYTDIEQSGPKWRDLIGCYTRYGDVRELLADIDDRYVIMNAGDELCLTFDALPAPAPGWTRDFVLIGDGWVKDGNFNTAFSKTVLPLPAHDVPDYDTPPGLLEDDPVYCRFPQDWQTYHTRSVAPVAFQRGIRPLRAREQEVSRQT